MNEEKEQQTEKRNQNISEDMGSLAIAGNIAKGSWILGKRMFNAAKSALEQKMSEVEEHKAKFDSKTDDELFEILHKCKGNAASSQFMGAWKLLKERGHDTETIKMMISEQ